MFVAISLLLLFFLFLLYPQVVITGAASGLVLWYQSLLPALFPFMVLTSLLLYSDSLERIPKMCIKPVSTLLHSSTYGTYAVIIGFLCGCPTGAKVIGDMVKIGKISKREGQHLLSFSTHISPMYLLGVVYPYVGLSLSKFLFLIYGVPLLYGIITGFKNNGQKEADLAPNYDILKSTSKHPLCLSTLIDQCLTESLVIISKVGGYVVLCSVITHLVSHWKYMPTTLLAFLEITNGVSMLHTKLPLIGLCSFGGCCMYLQIQCVLSGTELSLIKCIKTKLCLAFITMFLFIIFYSR